MNKVYATVGARKMKRKRVKMTKNNSNKNNNNTAFKRVPDSISDRQKESYDGEIRPHSAEKRVFTKRRNLF